MTTKMLKEIGEALKDNGFEFTEFGSRLNISSLDDKEYYIYFGVLRDNGESEGASMRLEGVLSKMRSKNIYLVLSPKIRTVRRYWEPMNKDTYIGPNEVMACFVEKGLFQSFEAAAIRVRASLKENFAYFQEDEKILKLDGLVTQMHDAVTAFQLGACDSQLVERLSVQLRAHLLAANITYSGVFVPYVETNAQRLDAEDMCTAAHCIDLICAGKE
jgi:hypothetical protein